MAEQKNQSSETYPKYSDFPFQDKLKDRKSHYKKSGIFGKIKHKETGAVKFRVKDIEDFIAEKGLSGNDEAYLVFHFAAYKGDDYQQNQKKPYYQANKISKNDFEDRPTLVLSYQKSPVSVESYDCGVLCPPPSDCLE